MTCAFARSVGGVVYAEFLISFMCFFTLFVSAVQLSVVATARLVVQHAAVQAVRAAVVTIDDDPVFYEDGQRKHLETKGSGKGGSTASKACCRRRSRWVFSSDDERNPFDYSVRKANTIIHLTASRAEADTAVSSGITDGHKFSLSYRMAAWAKIVTIPSPPPPSPLPDLEALEPSVFSRMSDVPGNGLEHLPDEKHKAIWGTQEFYRVFSLVNGGRARESDLFEGLR